jgi:hypothetical protein
VIAPVPERGLANRRLCIHPRSLYLCFGFRTAYAGADALDERTHWRYRLRRGRRFDTGTNVDFPEGAGVTARTPRFLAVVLPPTLWADQCCAACPGRKPSARRRIAGA